MEVLRVAARLALLKEIPCHESSQARATAKARREGVIALATRKLSRCVWEGGCKYISKKVSEQGEKATQQHKPGESEKAVAYDASRDTSRLPPCSFVPPYFVRLPSDFAP